MQAKKPLETDGRHGADARPKSDAPALAVHNLSKRFGYRVAFHDVSFEIGYGQVFGFVGPNGAGKTTTLRTLAMLIAPTSGSAIVAGIPLAPENGIEIRRRIAVMPEWASNPARSIGMELRRIVS